MNKTTREEIVAIIPEINEVFEGVIVFTEEHVKQDEEENFVLEITPTEEQLKQYVEN